MSKYCFVYKTNDSQQTFHRFPTDKEKLQVWCDALELDPLSLKKYSFICSANFSKAQIIKKPQWRTCLRPDAIPDVQAVRSIDHETQGIDILMDLTPQNSPNRNLVLSEMSSSASSTTRFSEVMTIEPSKKRSPSSSTSSAPEKVDAMRNLMLICLK
ncbi:hypothetical protein JTB14_033144 [Gonioctena quinquepunctata]|nr:hypothetical protein JTB14_033144 [Gonioctena quinquepunctata]